MSAKSTYHTFCVKWVEQGLVTGKTEAVTAENQPADDLDLDLDLDELEEEVLPEDDDTMSEGSDTDKPASEVDSDEEIRRKFNMDDYDDSEEDDFSKQIANFQSSQLKKPDENQNEATEDVDGFSCASDEENQEILDSDNLIVASRTDGDFNNLEVHVYNSNSGDFYCHHDIMLDQTPLTVEIVHNEISTFALLGMADGSIEAWDLALTNVSSPDLLLKDAHEDAVLDILRFNNDKDASNTYFFSSSVDNDVCLWKIPIVDLEESSTHIDEDSKGYECVSRASIKGKVQSMALSGDKTKIAFGTMNGNVRIHKFEDNVISDKKTNIWKVGKNIESGDTEDSILEIERVVWFKNDEFLLASTSLGELCVFKESVKSCLTKFNCHGASVPWIIPCYQGRGLVTASTDGFVKMWSIDVTDKVSPVSLVKRKKFGAGAIHAISLNPEDERSVAVGGDRSGVQVWNLSKDEDVCRAFGLEKVENDCPEHTVDLDHGEGEEELNDFLQNVEKDTLGVKTTKGKEQSEADQKKNKEKQEGGVKGKVQGSGKGTAKFENQNKNGNKTENKKNSNKRPNNNPNFKPPKKSNQNEPAQKKSKKPKFLTPDTI